MKTLSVIFASILVGFCAMMMTGCGGGDDNNSPDPNTNLTGTWTGTGTIDGQSGSYPTTLVLTDNNGSLTADWDGIAMTGTFDGTTLSLTITPFTESGVRLTGSMTGTFDGTYINDIRVSMTGTSGSQTQTITGRSTRLTRSANLADMGVGLAQTMSTSLTSSSK
jgi:hypothetical protein